MNKKAVDGRSRGKALVRPLVALLIMMGSALIFADTWDQTTTSDFNTSGSAAINTQVLNDTVRLSKQQYWWDPAQDWPVSMDGWQYRRAVYMNNEGASALSNFQVKVENPVYNETGLVGSWHLDENSGTVVTDMSGLSNYATLNSATWTGSGKVGSALTFDGADRRMLITTGGVAGNSPRTIMGWVKTTTANVIPFSLGNTSPGDANKSFALSLLNTTTWNLFGMSGTYDESIAVSGNAIDGSWHHVAITYDGILTLTAYMDGAIVGQTVRTAGEAYSTLGGFVIGGWSNADRFFNGQLDEVRMYNRALRPDEVKDLFAAKAALNCSDVRFANSNGDLLPYWMEKDGTFWVKVTGANSIPVGVSTMFMYYGNSSAAAASSGTDTFELFDDFNTGAAPDASKWTKVTASNWDATLSNKELKIVSTGTGSGDPFLTSNSSFDAIVFEGKARSVTNGSRVTIHYGFGTGSVWWTSTEGIRTGWDNGSAVIYENSGSTDTGRSFANTYTTFINGTNFRFKGVYHTAVNGILRTRIWNAASSEPIFWNVDTTNLYAHTGRVWLTAVTTGGTQETRYDDVRVRKYAAVEPIVHVGSETSASSLWQYRKTVALSNSGSALSDYQVKVTNPLYNETGLVGSWHFDEALGSVAVDTSGCNNNGTLTNGPTWTGNGRFGNYISLDGTNDHVVVPSSTSLSMQSELTLEAWIYPRSTSIGSVIAKNGPYALTYGNAQTVPTQTQKVGGGIYTSSWTWINGSSTIPLNEWSHVVLTYNGSAIKVYFNGAEDGSTPASGSMTVTGDSVRIGYGATGLNHYFNGSLDEVRIYNRALSLPEVQLRYGAGTPKLKHNYGDIRFANSSMVELPHWMEKDGTFWVKAVGTNSVPAGASNIYMYYGNSSANSAVNGANTFDFFDDFSDAYMTDWTTSSGTWSVDMGDYSMKQTATTEVNAGRYFSHTDCVYEGKVMLLNAGADPNVWLTYRKSGISSNFDATNLAMGLAGWNSQYSIWNGSTNTIAGSGASLSANLWYDLKAVMAGTSLALSVNGTQQLTNNAATVTSGFYVGVRSNVTGAKYDNLRVRRYAASEPSATLGFETPPYNPSGTYTSAAHDTTLADSAIDLFSWTKTGTGTLTMQVRAGNTDPSGWDSTDPSWEDVDNGDSSVVSEGRYIQYRAALTGDSLSYDPVLEDVTLNYTLQIIPPTNSVSCARVANTWYSTATFTFSNDLGFGADIDKYYYSWDINSTHTFTGSELQWNSGELSVNSTTDGSWYMHYLPKSSTNTLGTAQDLGPFKFDGTAPSPATLTAPLADANVTDSTASFAWDLVTDVSGESYSLQVDKFTSFLAPIIDVVDISASPYTLSGSGSEFLVGNTTYYWRVLVTDGAGNSTASSYRKFTTTSAMPQIVNSSTGVAYPDLQAALDGPTTVAGNVINVGDQIAHDENIAMDKDVTIQNGLLAPTSGFAVTGQGSSGGEVLRNCVITAGGLDSLALGENLTIYGTDAGNPVLVKNSTLVNCVIKIGTTITDCTLENCFIEATPAFFVDVFGGDFHLNTSATAMLDKAKNLSSEFTTDKDGMARGVNILDISNFDSGAWDIGAYELKLDSGYITPGSVTAEPPNKPVIVYPADGTEGFLADVNVSWTYSGAAVAASFTVEWSTDPAFVIEAHSASGIASQSCLLEDLDEDAVIYWRVKGVNEYGESSWSDARSFITNYGELSKQAPSAPVPTYPSYGATGIDSDTVFMWEYSGFATAGSYTVEWSVISTMTGSVHVIDGIESEALQIEGLPLEAAIYWRVKAVNPYGESDWSSKMQFVTTEDSVIFAEPGELSFSMTANEAAPMKKDITVFSGMAGDEEWTVSVNGGWMTVSQTSGSFTGSKVFTIEVSVSPLGLIAGENYVGAVTVALASGLNEIAIPVYLEVTEAVDGGGGGDGGSGGIADLQPPTPMSPADGQGGLGFIPYLIWSAESNATSYIVQVGRDSAFTMISVSQEVTSPQYLPPVLEMGTIYYWRVKSLNSAKMSVWSSVRSFTLSPEVENVPSKCFIGSLFY